MRAPAPFVRLAAWLSGSARAQVALLGAFFFFNELGAYFTGVLASTLLVKRAGADCLPLVYLVLNLAFLPITIMVILKPPKSSGAMVRKSLAVFLVLFACAIPFSSSSSAVLLGAVYVSARLGKLMVTTFDAGMVAETLPLREAKAATPRLLACQTAGLVAGGLLLNPLLAYAGSAGAYVFFWCCVAVALGVVALLGACLPGAVVEKPAPVAPRSLKATVQDAVGQLAGSPLPRLMGILGFFAIGMRYLLEYIFAAAQARHFTSETAMAAFAGNFEAGLSITVVIVQLALVGTLMRRLKVGGMVLVLPAAMIVSLSLAAVTGSFQTICAAQFLYWLTFDCCSQAARPVMMGAVPPAMLARVPILLTVANICGSFTTSLLLVPLARSGSTTLALATAVAMAVVFFAAALPAGRIYAETLTATLDAMDTRGRAEVLAALGSGEEVDRGARIGVLLASADPALRLRAVREAAALGPAAGVPLCFERLDREEDPLVRAALLGTLATWRPSGFAPVLWRHLADPDVRVRANALEGLAFYAAEADVQTCLVDKLKTAADPDAPVPERERVAAVLAAVRSCTDRETLARALDVLAAMRDAPATASRAAAAAGMGRLGYAFFLEDLTRLLADPERTVRSAALDGIVALAAPSAHASLAAAHAVEADADLKERIGRALDTLADETAGAIAGVLDALSGEERAAVRRVLSEAVAPGDPRMRVIRAALGVEQPAVRRELVRLARMADGPMLAALERCISGAQVDLGPLLEYLGAQPAGTGPDSEALGRLVDEHTEPSLAEHVKRVAARLWKYTAIAELLVSRAGDERSRAIAARAAEAQRAALEHLLSVSVLACASPDRARRLMDAALGDDRHKSSLALELLEDQLPARVREPVFPVLEAFSDAQARRDRAYSFSGLAAGDPEARALDEAAQEGLA